MGKGEEVGTFIGVVAALGLGLLGAAIIDAFSKSKCPHCKSSVNQNAPYCPMCHTVLRWYWMESVELAKEMSGVHLSKNIASVVFFVSGCGVLLNYYVPNLMPVKLISGMSYYLFIGLLGMVSFTIRHRNNPHISSEICPRCKNGVKYTGIECLSDDCKYKVKF